MANVYTQNTKRYADEGNYQCIAENGVTLSEAGFQDGFLLRIWCKCTDGRNRRVIITRLRVY